MDRNIRWRLCLALIGFWLIPQLWTGKLYSQTSNDATVEGILPVQASYNVGDTLRIYGIEIFDFIASNCDRMIFTIPPGGAGDTISFGAPISPSLGQYWGFNGNTTNLGTTSPPYPAGTRDTVYFVVPCTWVAGNYSVHFWDDEGCNGGGTSNTFPFVVSGAAASASPYDMGYPGNGIYCLGEPLQTPVNTIGANTINTSGTYLDLTSPSIVTNSTTGAIIPYSGAIGLHTIQFTHAFNGCVYIDQVEIRDTQRDTMDYGGSVFCKSTPGATLVSPLAVAGTFSLTPNLPGGINTSSGALDFSVLSAGAYQVTFSPSNPDDCFAAPALNFLLTELDSAIFDYPAEFCFGDPVGGWPTSIDYKPSTGGFFLP